MTVAELQKLISEVPPQTEVKVQVEDGLCLGFVPVRSTRRDVCPWARLHGDPEAERAALQRWCGGDLKKEFFIITANSGRHDGDSDKRR